jgi:hypothetical protein
MSIGFEANSSPFADAESREEPEPTEQKGVPAVSRIQNQAVRAAGKVKDCGYESE